MLGPDAFRAICLECLEEFEVQAQVIEPDDDDGLAIRLTRVGDSSEQLFLDNLYRRIGAENDPESRVELVSTHFEKMGQAREESAAPLSLDAIVPVVRPRSALEMPGADEIVSRPLVGDLCQALAIDGEVSIHYLTEDRVSELGALPDEIWDRAEENLLRQFSPLQVAMASHDRGGKVLLPAEGDFFASSLLVAEPVREALADQVKGDLLAAVPSRMLLAVSGTDEPGGVDAFRRFVEEVHRDDGDALSSSVLRWDGVSWVEMK